MKFKVATIIATIALGLALLYGADAFFSLSGIGFLPVDTKVVRLVIGTAAAIMPIIAYFLSRKKTSRVLGLLIMATGILMTSGALAASMIMTQNVSDLKSFMQNIASFWPVIGLGIFNIALGIKKLG